MNLSPTSLAHVSARHPWRTLAVWAVLFVAAGAIIVTMLGGSLSPKMELLSKPDSKRADDLLQQHMPQAPSELVVVTSGRATIDQPAFRADIARLNARLHALQPRVVTRVVDYYETGMKSLVSADRHNLLVPVVMTGSLQDAQKNVSVLRQAVSGADQPDFRSLVVGTPSVNEDLTTAAKRSAAKGEGIGMPLALIVLLIVFGTAVAAGLPIFLGVIAIVLALALTALLGRVITVSVFATNIITMMGLAVGIDYTLFIVSRFREELAKGLAIADAVAVASGTAGKAVFFSGLTVMLALLGLLIVPTTIASSLGAGAMLVVAMAVLAALTLLPAVLRLAGTRVNRLRLPYLGRRLLTGRTSGKGTMWAGLARRVMRRPAIALVIGVGLLVLAASPLIGMKTGVSGVEGLPKGFEAKQAFAVLDREFSGGLMNPVQIVVDDSATSPQVKADIGTLRAELAADGSFGPTLVQRAGDLTLVQTPLAGPATGDLALDKVRELRNAYVPRAFGESGTNVYVTGETARNIDDINAVNGRMPLVFGIVLSLSFVLLLVAFRSVVIPATAIVMNLLSVGAAYGLITLVFQKGIGIALLGFQKAPTIEDWVPLFLFSILFGLSMDYQVFLLSRIKEAYDGTHDNDAAIVRGVSSTAGIITGAALIMVAVFAGFASGDLGMLQQLGFGLGVAVLLDATVVRILLVPAAMRVLAGANWYLPRWLQWLPRWNVEGVGEQDDMAKAGRKRGHGGIHPVHAPFGQTEPARVRGAAMEFKRPQF